MEAAHKKLIIKCGIKLFEAESPPISGTILSNTVNKRNTNQKIVWINIFKGSFMLKFSLYDFSEKKFIQSYMNNS